MKKEWSDFVKANSGYFQISRETDDMVHLNTREHGSIGDEEYGQEDADYARYIIKKVKEKYPKTRSRLYNIDEWVELELTYVPDEKEVPKKSFEDYKKELYKNINKEWKGKKHNGWEYLGMDLAGVIDWQKGDYTVKATPFWDKSKDTIAIDAIKYEDSILYVDEIPFEPTYDVEKDTDRYIKLIEKEFSKTTSGTFADGGYMAKGGEMSDKKTILKIQNMMDDERMTLKLQKEFKGKDLFEDEIVDEYDVKQFDYKEDSDKIEKFIRMKKNKFYVVPFDNQDDSYYYILVPKDKMAKGGKVRSVKEYNKLVDQKQKIVINLSPKEIAEMWNKNVGKMSQITEAEAAKPNMKMYLSNLLIEKELTDEEHDKYFEEGGYMARGGKLKSNPAKFRDKVNAITKKLAGTKVPKKYKKDYGATYDKKEANTAAKRIAGAKLAEVRAKLAKKKK